MAFELGLKAVDPAYEWTYVGDRLASTTSPRPREAFNNLDAKGVGAVYPYLGGAHEAVVQAGQREGRRHHDERRLVEGLRAGPT